MPNPSTPSADRPDINRPPLSPHRFTHQAMATIFEIIIDHPDRAYAQQAAWAAFQVADNLEKALSRFLEYSDICRINSAKTGDKLVIGLDAFTCLQECNRMYMLTGGAFDISVGALMDCWLDKDKKLKNPAAEELQALMQNRGKTLLLLNDADYSVEIKHSPLHIDLGGFGKGYAVDRMAESLAEWDIENYILHGGLSSVRAHGGMSGQTGWPVSISNPFQNYAPLRQFNLHNRCMNGSGLQKGNHIIDPRSGRPLTIQRAAWAFSPDAASGDALSTAFMVMSLDEIGQLCRTHHEFQAVIIEMENAQPGAEKVYYYGDIVQ
ncbi:MAG TPA: FAD:protein FMN transferase [bacterium]|nr:FAD:protein FMN transferase [bacterium]HPN45069.1 FAD:protein FMN transferase [bacterium]